jgi:DNA-directed RNA polymerase subunit E'/Rpb7
MWLTHAQIKISDLVQIQPENFGKPSSLTLEDNINAKYANRVRRSTPWD